MPEDQDQDDKGSVMLSVGVVGGLEPFDVLKPNTWQEYLERFEFYAITNRIVSADIKKATLITVGGQELYHAIVSVAAPTKVTEINYADLVKRLTDHFLPQKTVWMARYEFQHRVQLPDESAHQFMAELQRLAADCKFLTLLDSMLITQFICGLRSEPVQRRLLQEQEDTLTKAVALQTATAAECASKQQEAMREDVVKNVRGQKQGSSQRGGQRDGQGEERKCSRCGSMHDGECKWKDAVCHACGKVGHLAKVCKSGQGKGSGQKKTHGRRQRGRPVNNVQEASAGDVIWATIGFAGKSARLEVDSGSPYTMISHREFLKLLPGTKLNTQTKWIKDYQGGRIMIRGETCVTVTYNGEEIHGLPLIVVECEGQSIVGRNWFRALGIVVSGVHAIRSSPTIADVLKEYAEVFSETLGCYTGPPVKLELVPGAQPRALSPRNVPLPLREAVEKELHRLESQGILERIEYAEWATPIVPVRKSDNSIRICGDYKSTINQHIRPHAHKVPCVNDLLARLDGGRVYIKLDMSQAYQQLVVDKDTAKMQAITTHKGTFAVNRLQFGVAAAPGIFQGLMEKLLGRVENVLTFFDDFIIVGRTTEELAVKLREVLKIFKDNGLRLKKEKCIFQASSVTFLGHQVDGNGIRPVEDKVKAIRDSPDPKNKKELQAFLGLLGFYQPFLKNKATIAEPLHRLLDKDQGWTWTKVHSQAMDNLKKLLSSDLILTHYSLSRPVSIVADASPYGVGGVLFHTMEDKTEKPVAFFSKTLSDPQRNYSQLDRESVALVEAVKKFHHYVYGRHFTLFTDHKPLLGILGKDKCPEVISPTMLRRRIFLSAYDVELVHRSGERMGNADFLSRSPLSGETINFVDHRIEHPFTSRELANETLKDQTLKEVLRWTREGWPATTKRLSDELIPYHRKKSELSIEGNCLLWGSRLVIPTRSRKQILAALHVSHPGIVKMKVLARQYVYWPAIDKDIEAVVHKCRECQETRGDQENQVHPWEPTDKPWSRIHIDHAGPFRGRLYLIVVDAGTRFIDASIVPSTAASPTITRLRELFATHGLPDTIVSDNGSGFTSEVFQRFCKRNAIQHYRVAPYMASSNGLAERTVQTVKNFLKKLAPGDDVPAELACFLLTHRTTTLPCGKSPAELLMGRRVETYFDKLRPTQERTYKQGKFQMMDPVWARDYKKNEKSWVKAQVLKQIGHKCFKVELTDGRVVKRHEQQLRRRVDEVWMPPRVEKGSDTDSVYEDAVDIPIATAECSTPGEGPSERPQRIRKQTVFYQS